MYSFATVYFVILYENKAFVVSYVTCNSSYSHNAKITSQASAVFSVTHRVLSKWTAEQYKILQQKPVGLFIGKNLVMQYVSWYKGYIV